MWFCGDPCEDRDMCFWLCLFSPGSSDVHLKGFCVGRRAWSAEYQGRTGAEVFFPVRGGGCSSALEEAEKLILAAAGVSLWEC